MRLNACENLYKNALVFSASYSDNDEMSDFLRANRNRKIFGTLILLATITKEYRLVPST